MTRAAHILLIIGGGIAAYKSSELIRLIKKAGMTVRCVLTESGAQFVTPMTLAALSENEVHSTLWSLKDEAEMGHIQLSREADLVVVCPATANLLAKMAGGIADDLATTLLLATDTQVLAVPAMNVRMWDHPATQRNIEQLRRDGLIIMPPDEGDMACGEFGPGRLPEPPAVLAEIVRHLENGNAEASGLIGANELRANPLEGQPAFAPDQHRPLHGKHVLVTAGPTREPIDPVRYIANRSTGRQGFAIAAAAAEAGAQVTLIAGPVHLPTPTGVMRVDVETALEMEAAVHDSLPSDVAIMVAAVSDWRTDTHSDQKIKKQKGEALPPLNLTENPDILAGLAKHEQRPGLLIGFAAETQKIEEHARAKLAKKGCDWIIANDVSGDVMGGADNSVHIVTTDGIEIWERLPKPEVARRLISKIIEEI